MLCKYHDRRNRILKLKIPGRELLVQLWCSTRVRLQVASIKSPVPSSGTLSIVDREFLLLAGGIGDFMHGYYSVTGMYFVA